MRCILIVGVVKIQTAPNLLFLFLLVFLLRRSAATHTAKLWERALLFLIFCFLFSSHISKRDKLLGWRNPLETSEFEIQAEVYNQLRTKFKKVRGEFHYKHPENDKNRGRFDVAVLDEHDKPFLIIEVKRGNKKNFYKQINRYKDLTGKPVMAVAGMEQALNVLSMVENIIGIPVPAHGDIYLEGKGYTPFVPTETPSKVPWE